MDQVRVLPAYPLNDFCKEFGLGRTFAYGEILMGRLRVYKVGNKTMVAGEDALAWRDAYRNASPPRRA